MINHVDKIKKFKDQLFVLDRKQNQIFIFNSSGMFLSKIAKEGKGHGEYLMIADFDIQPITGDVYILDRMNNKILVYKEGGVLKN